MSSSLLAPLPRRALYWALAAAAFSAGCTPSTPTTPAEAIRPALVFPVRDAGSASLQLVGEIRATQRAELAFAVGGRVHSVMVNPGDNVQRGQVLARLDDQPLRAQWAAAAGDVARAKAHATELAQRVDRVRQAHQAGATGAGEWTAVQAELAAAEAALKAAQAQESTALWSLEQAQLRAPFSGVVGVRHLEAGQTAGPGAPAISIDGAGRELVMIAPANLPLRAGQVVTLTPANILANAGPQRTETLSSRVLRVASRHEAGGTVSVTLVAPANAPVGSTWAVNLPSAASSAKAISAAGVLIPLRAMVPGTQAGQGYVLRLAQDGKTTERVDVTFGTPQGEWVQVTQGLARTDRVVIAGAAQLKPGTVVMPVAPAGSPL